MTQPNGCPFTALFLVSSEKTPVSHHGALAPAAVVVSWENRRWISVLRHLGKRTSVSEL